jgi:hypothetical protein
MLRTLLWQGQLLSHLLVCTPAKWLALMACSKCFQALTSIRALPSSMLPHQYACPTHQASHQAGSSGACMLVAKETSVDNPQIGKSTKHYISMTSVCQQLCTVCSVWLQAAHWQFPRTSIQQRGSPAAGATATAAAGAAATRPLLYFILVITMTACCCISLMETPHMQLPK